MARVSSRRPKAGAAAPAVPANVKAAASRLKAGRATSADQKLLREWEARSKGPRPKSAAVEAKIAEGSVVGRAEHTYAYAQEARVTRAIGGEHMPDNEPIDARVVIGKVEHGVEIKTLMKGSKRNLTMHADALLRKAEWQAAAPGRAMHTVAIDRRHDFGGGANAGAYSGHEIYYRRGAGPYALSKMYRVKDEAELKRLIAMPDDRLPPAARGSLPSGPELEKLRAEAEKAHASRLRKDRARKQRLREERDAARAAGS